MKTVHLKSKSIGQYSHVCKNIYEVTPERPRTGRTVFLGHLNKMRLMMKDKQWQDPKDDKDRQGSWRADDGPL